MKAVTGIDENGQLRDGPYQQLFKGGTVACEGRFDHGRKTGEWNYYYMGSGALKATGRCEDDRMVGEWKWYHENGELMQIGQFDDEEMKTGVWKRYHPNGKPMDEIPFERGKKTGKGEKFDSE